MNLISVFKRSLYDAVSRQQRRQAEMCRVKHSSHSLSGEKKNAFVQILLWWQT